MEGTTTTLVEVPLRVMPHHRQADPVAVALLLAALVVAAALILRTAFLTGQEVAARQMGHVGPLTGRHGRFQAEESDGS